MHGLARSVTGWWYKVKALLCYLLGWRRIYLRVDELIYIDDHGVVVAFTADAFFLRVGEGVRGEWWYAILPARD